MEAGKKDSPVDQIFILYKDDVEASRLIPEKDIHILQIYLVDALMNAEVLLPQEEEFKGYEGSNLVKAKVIRLFCDEDGNIMRNVNI